MFTLPVLRIMLKCILLMQHNCILWIEVYHTFYILKISSFIHSKCIKNLESLNQLFIIKV